MSGLVIYIGMSSSGYKGILIVFDYDNMYIEPTSSCYICGVR